MTDPLPPNFNEPHARNDSTSDVERAGLDEAKTAMAEDRTLLASERTFVAALRTGLAFGGLGLGFNAVFGSANPQWIARALASLFVLIGIVVVILAERRVVSVWSKLDAHTAARDTPAKLRAVAWSSVVALVGLLVALWLLI